MARSSPDPGCLRSRGVPGPSGLALAGAREAPSSAAPPRGVAGIPRARRERRGGGARAWAARSRAEPSGAEQPRPPPPGCALPSWDPRVRAQRRASAAARGSRPCPRPSPGRRPCAPCTLPPPAARCHGPSTLRPGVSAHSDGAAPACPRGLSPSRRVCQAQPRSSARYLGRSEMRGHAARVGRRPRRG